MLTADVNGTTIAYRIDGPQDGAPVLLGHSLFFDHTMFDPLTELLVAGGHRVVRYDQRGQGASARAPREALSMDVLADDAVALIEALALGRVHAVGNSMGGFVALRLAARRPDLLLSAGALGSSAEEEHQLAAFEPLVELMGEQGTEPVIDTLLHIMFGDASLAAGGPMIDHWRARMLALDDTIADCAHQVIYRTSIVDELAGCTVPVLAIAGAEDHAYPPPVSSDNIAAATGGTAVTLDAAGHSVALEQPQATAEHLLAHFAAAERAAAAQV